MNLFFYTFFSFLFFIFFVVAAAFHFYFIFLLSCIKSFHLTILYRRCCCCWMNEEKEREEEEKNTNEQNIVKRKEKKICREQMLHKYTKSAWNALNVCTYILYAYAYGFCLLFAWFSTDLHTHTTLPYDLLQFKIKHHSPYFTVKIPKWVFGIYKFHACEYISSLTSLIVNLNVNMWQ